MTSRRFDPRSAVRIAAALAALVVVVLGVLVGAALVLGARVRGESMTPTLTDGERIVMIPGSGDEADRFTVVVFHVKQESSAIVKRVIAVAGDRIEIDARRGPGVVLLQLRGQGPWYRVTVPTWRHNWHLATACCTARGTSPGASDVAGAPAGSAGGPIVQTVPDGEFFFLGDNPDASDDSRKFGWGSVNDVEGRVSLAVWPLSRFGGIGNAPKLTPVAAPTR